MIDGNRSYTAIQALDILSLAAAHIEHGWTRWVLARTANGTGVFADHPQAESWCVIGAFRVASHLLIDDPQLVWETDTHPLKQLTGRTHGQIVFFNNTEANSPDDILALLSDAAHALSSK